MPDLKDVQKIESMLLKTMDKFLEDVDAALVDHPFWDEQIAAQMTDAAMSVVKAVWISQELSEHGNVAVEALH